MKTYQDIHNCLENNKFSGKYGAALASYYGLVKATKDVSITPANEGVPSPFTLEKCDTWDKIITLDPFGMDSKRPTIAATRSNLNIPELKGKLPIDGIHVLNDDSIPCTKFGIEHAWHLPKLAERLQTTEKRLRCSLHEHTGIGDVLDEERPVFLPPIPGTTVYMFGDIKNKDVETTVRVHDECNGSDVFGTDICTCRPYLMFAIGEAVKTAQRGGFGLVVYYRKEGRALGEITKFCVYNARKAQDGGDRPETYFENTEKIAGIVDARFQPLMPDVLHLLGITRVDNWLSMSNEKSDAARSQGIEIRNQIDLPDDLIPANAHIEIDAKIASGYFSSRK